MQIDFPNAPADLSGLAGDTDRIPNVRLWGNQNIKFVSTGGKEEMNAFASYDLPKKKLLQMNAMPKAARSAKSLGVLKGGKAAATQFASRELYPLSGAGSSARSENHSDLVSSLVTGVE